MPWPQTVVLPFNAVPHNPAQCDYHGPYNKLLSYLFPVDSHFTVCPQYLRHGSRLSADWTVTYLQNQDNHPVFILELKRPSEMENASSRQRADDQVRARMMELAVACPLPTLHAISAIGTELCFYTLNTAQAGPAAIIPIEIPRDNDVANDTAPIDRWDCDVLDIDGEDRLRDVVAEIMQGCENLP